MNEHEELSDLVDDEFEAATRVLPKSAGWSYPPVAMTQAAPPKKSDAPVWAAVAGMSAVFLLAAAAGAAYLVREHLRANDASSESAAAAPTETAAPAETAAPPPVTTQPIEPLAPTPSAETTSHASAPAPRGSGTLQTFAAGRGKTILVDGKAVGVGGAYVKVACGRHTVAVGNGRARSYEIPCNGGLVTVGTPDGT